MLSGKEFLTTKSIASVDKSEQNTAYMLLNNAFFQAMFQEK